MINSSASDVATALRGLLATKVMLSNPHVCCDPMHTHRILNNSDWWEGVSAVNFVSEIARHFRLSTMLRKER